MQSPHRSSYGQKHGHEFSSAQHGQSNDFVSCGHWQPFSDLKNRKVQIFFSKISPNVFRKQIF